MKSPKSVKDLLELDRHRFKEAFLLATAADKLREAWQSHKSQSSDIFDFFPIRAVTILEALFRLLVAETIDTKRPNVDSLKRLLGDFKLDLDYAVHLYDQRISIGLIVAYSIPLNKVDQLISVLDALVPSFSAALPKIEDNVFAAAERKGQPIILNVNQTLEQLTRLFELRHILAHEFRTTPCYEAAEIDGFLASAAIFSRAAVLHVFGELYNAWPNTQADITESAWTDLSEAQEQMRGLLDLLRSKSSEIYATELGYEQECWNNYADACAQIEAIQFIGGTMEPVVRSSALRKLVAERIDILERRLGEFEPLERR